MRKAAKRRRVDDYDCRACGAVRTISKRLSESSETGVECPKCSEVMAKRWAVPMLNLGRASKPPLKVLMPPPAAPDRPLIGGLFADGPGIIVDCHFENLDWAVRSTGDLTVINTSHTPPKR